jgi:hypothetical protein
LGRNVGLKNNTQVSGIGDLPTQPIGWYEFTGVAPGNYMIEISRKGFIPRLVKVIVDDNKYLGHKELVAGDLLDASSVDIRSYSNIKSKTGAAYPSVGYIPAYDFNGIKAINQSGITNLGVNIGATARIYFETDTLLSEY